MVVVAVVWGGGSPHIVQVGEEEVTGHWEGRGCGSGIVHFHSSHYLTPSLRWSGSPVEGDY